jgi:phosphatidylglycerol:prolipoprotein diacylglycerol transferase
LYEAFFEGLVLFIILNLYARKNPPTMALSGAFGLGYGIFRFMVEFVRQPDAHIQYLAFGWLTMGQVLSFPMILLGGFMIYWSYYKAAIKR